MIGWGFQPEACSRAAGSPKAVKQISLWLTSPAKRTTILSCLFCFNRLRFLTQLSICLLDCWYQPYGRTTRRSSSETPPPMPKTKDGYQRCREFPSDSNNQRWYNPRGKPGAACEVQNPHIPEQCQNLCSQYLTGNRAMSQLWAALGLISEASDLARLNTLGSTTTNPEARDSADTALSPNFTPCPPTR